MVMNGGSFRSGSRVHTDEYDGIKLRKLTEWTESDAMFLRKLINTTDEAEEKSDKLSPWSKFIFPSESFRLCLDERFARRQKYLRSYKFGEDQKDTIIGKTKKLLQLKKLNWRSNNESKDGAPSVLKGGLKFLLSCTPKVHSPKS